MIILKIFYIVNRQKHILLKKMKRFFFYIGYYIILYGFMQRHRTCTYNTRPLYQCKHKSQFHTVFRIKYRWWLDVSDSTRTESRVDSLQI